MKRLSTLQLALSYAGMFFGAGFVSGQEIRQFFGVFGTAGLFGLVLSALLFFLAGAAFFDAARKDPELTTGELLVPGRHPFLSALTELAEDILLFGVVIIMTAGAGAMVHQVTGLPAAAAGLLFAGLIFAASLKNMRSVVTVFSVLAPCLTVCAVFTAVYVLVFFKGTEGAAESVLSGAAGNAEAAASGSPLIHGPWSAAVLYAVYNLFGSFSIMQAMMPILPDRKRTLRGIALGSLLLLIPAECVAASMLAVPRCAAEEIPTAYLAGLLSPWFRDLYSLLMLAGMASAALGCLVGFLEQLRLRAASAGLLSAGGFPWRRASAAVCLAAFALSLAGFGSLIGLIYPLFGYLGIPCVLLLLLRFAAERCRVLFTLSE